MSASERPAERARSGSAPVLEVEHARVEFGGVVALDDVSLRVHPGEVVAVIGPNGAGKSTVFNVISGFLTPKAGSVRLAGEEVSGRAAWARARLGIGRTFQRVQLFPGATVLDTVAAAAYADIPSGLVSDGLTLPSARGGRAEARERARAVLDFLGLLDLAELPAQKLPAGTARLVEVARALALGPKVLLADEPATGMDPAESRALGELLAKVARATGAGVLVVEHDVATVLGISDWVYVLDFGRRIADGTPAQIRRDPAVIAAYLGEGAASRARRKVAGSDARPAASGGPRVNGAALLRLKGVRVRYGAFEAVRGVDLEVQDGDAVALLGPNGAGKTSLLRAISGLVPLAGGAVVFADRDLGRARPEARTRLGLAHIPESRGIFARLSVRENLVLAAAGAGLRGREAQTGIDSSTSAFPVLAERMDQMAGTLSGGEQQMLALARALLTRPRLLVLDEVSLGLAPKVVADIFARLARVREQGVAVLVVEQFVARALELCDRAYVLKKGEVVASGLCEEIPPEVLASGYMGEVAAAPRARRRAARV